MDSKFTKSLLISFTLVSITGCSLPAYKTVYKPVRSVQYSAEVQSSICQSEAQVVYAQKYNELMSQYQAQQSACRNAANSSNNTTVNVYGSQNSSGLRGSLSGLSNATDSYVKNASCNDYFMTTKASNGASSISSATFSSCMAKAGFIAKKVCYRNCDR